MDWSPDRGLQLRMGVTLAIQTLTLLAAVLATGVVLTLGIGGVVQLLVGDGVLSLRAYALLGVVVTLVVAGVVVYGECDAPGYAVAVTGARPVDGTDAPALVSTVRGVARQVDVPVPQVHVAPTDEPLSLTTGFHPARARLVVSEGLLDALSDRERRAVVAHELAHVKNRDTAVMTAVSLPVAAASRVLDLLRAPTPGVDHGVASRADYADALVTVGLLLVAPVWLVGRLTTASFARAREFAADRGAVAITGDPAALASALATIDDGLGDRPGEDLREHTVAVFAIAEPARPAGLLSRAFATHPSIAARIDRLRALERAQASG